MPTYKLLVLVLSALVTVVMVKPRLLEGYDIGTHQQIAGQAVDLSSVGLHAKDQLGFSAGRNEIFLGRSVRDWISL
jgi:hypothetical protein